MYKYPSNASSFICVYTYICMCSAHCNTLQHTATHCNTLYLYTSTAYCIRVSFNPSDLNLLGLFSTDRGKRDLENEIIDRDMEVEFACVYVYICMIVCFYICIYSFSYIWPAAALRLLGGHGNGKPGVGCKSAQTFSQLKHRKRYTYAPRIIHTRITEELRKPFRVPSVRVCIYISMYPYMYTYHFDNYLHMYICISQNICIYMCVYMYIHIRIHIYIHIHVYIYMYIYVYVCLYVCTYICIYIYTDVYTYI